MGKVKEEIDKKLDVSEVCKKLYQLDLLKCLLLTHNQRIIFDNLKNFKVEIDETPMKRTTIFNDLLQPIISTAKKEIESSPNKTEVDKRLLLLYDKQLAS